MTELRFTVLGTPRAWYDGVEVDLGTRQQREMFALLVLRAGRVVSPADFVTLLWGGSPPPSAFNGVYRFANSLRRILDRGNGVMDRAGGGYRLVLPAGSTDLETFHRHLARARIAGGRTAVERYAAALSLVAGRCGGRAPDQPRVADFAAVDDEIVHAVLEAATLATAAGCADRIREPLELAVKLYPEEVRLREALRLIADRETPARATMRPRQLPHDLPGFAGRLAELRRANTLLGQNGASVRALSVDGIPGVGKSTFAVHWARDVAPRFPDGQLYADLRDPTTTVPATLLAFLTALGVPEAAIPGDTPGRIRRYRAVLADRRVLILLDNTDDVEDLESLIPGRGMSFAVMTSRDSGATDAEGIATMTLDVPPTADAARILKRRLDFRAPADAVAALVEACASLPAALAVAAAVANTRPVADLRKFATEFHDYAGDVVSLADLVRSYLD